MAQDYEGMYDIASMDDGEIKALIEQELSDTEDIDPADVEVVVEGGRVTLEGRVGTEHDLQVIEHVVTDLLGIEEVTNNMVVDELRRGEQPEAADDAALALAARGSSGSSGAGDRTSDEAKHLMDDVAGEQFGTSDMGEAIEEGLSYNPPTSPIQDGNLSRENH